MLFQLLFIQIYHNFCLFANSALQQSRKRAKFNFNKKRRSLAEHFVRCLARKRTISAAASTRSDHQICASVSVLNSALVVKGLFPVLAGKKKNSSLIGSRRWVTGVKRCLNKVTDSVCLPQWKRKRHCRMTAYQQHQQHGTFGALLAFTLIHPIYSFYLRRTLPISHCRIQLYDC